MEEILVNKMIEQLKKMGGESLLALNNSISEAFFGVLGSESFNSEGVRTLADFQTRLTNAISATVYELDRINNLPKIK